MGILVSELDGIGATMGAATGAGSMGPQRTPSQGPFEPHECKVLRAAAPSSSRAFHLSRRLQQAQARAAQRQAMLDMLPMAMFVVDGDARIIDRNQAADDLLSKGDGLLGHRERLVATQPSETAQLARLVKEATRGTVGGGSCRVSRPDGNFYAVIVAPIKSALTGRGAPAALVVANDLGANHDPPRDSLRTLYGLTNAEQALGIALAQGQRIETIAEQRGVSSETVRVQLKAVFAKTDCDRQATLVRKLAAVPRLLQ